MSPIKLKYFSCGEYGEKYGRPHYHAIVFGIDWNDEDVINKCWNKGFIKIGGVTRKSCAYVTDYVMKKWSKKDENERYKEIGMEPPFQLVSQGLGLRYAYDNRTQLQDDLGTSLDGQRVGLPRYYVRKLEIDTDIMKEYSKSAKAEKVANLCRRLGDNRGWSSDVYYYSRYDGKPLFTNPLADYLRKEAVQREINYRSKDRFRKGSF